MPKAAFNESIKLDFLFMPLSLTPALARADDDNSKAIMATIAIPAKYAIVGSCFLISLVKNQPTKHGTLTGYI